MSATLPLEDYRYLSQLLEAVDGAVAPLAATLRAKLASARICGPDEEHQNVVKLGSRVRYRVAGGPVEERILVPASQYLPDGSRLLAESTLGLAMLGRRAGDSVTTPWQALADAFVEIIHVVADKELVQAEGGN